MASLCTHLQSGIFSSYEQFPLSFVTMINESVTNSFLYCSNKTPLQLVDSSLYASLWGCLYGNQASKTEVVVCVVWKTISLFFQSHNNVLPRLSM